MQTFHLDKLLAEQQRSNERWLEFLRVPSLSMGVYHLPANQPDPQRPHGEDEVYYVVSGRASFEIGDQRQPVEPGMLIFVERSVAHRFCDIAEDLTLLVFFAPAEGRHEPR